MKQLIRLRVNGIDEEVFVEPWKSLAEVLREDCGSCLSCQG